MRTTTGSTLPVDACATLTAAARALAADGPEAAGTALDGVVAHLGLRSAVLRETESGALLAVAGEVLHAVPLRRDATGPEAVVELPVRAPALRPATLTVIGARPAHLPVLRAVSSVLALWLLQRPTTGPAALPLTLLEAADADADAVADDLHDGPMQELVFARLAADAAVRGADAACARDAVQAALQSMRRALWLLRPRGGGEDGLGAALAQLSERLVEGGRPGLLLDVDAAAAAGLDPQAAALSYRLVQALARTGDAPVPVVLTRVSGTARLHVRTGVLPAPERWAAKARALGARLTVDGNEGVVLSVPVAPGTTSLEIEAIP